MVGLWIGLYFIKGFCYTLVAHSLLFLLLPVGSSHRVYQLWCGGRLLLCRRGRCVCCSAHSEFHLFNFVLDCFPGFKRSTTHETKITCCRTELRDLHCFSLHLCLPVAIFPSLTFLHFLQHTHARAHTHARTNAHTHTPITSLWNSSTSQVTFLRSL